MLAEARPSRALRPSYFLLLPLFAALTSCADPVTLAPNRDLVDGEWTGDVIINDEVWYDWTVEEPTVEIETGEESQPEMFSSQLMALEAEPIIRVGLYYVDLSTQTLRIGGRDNSDSFELRSNTVNGAVLASGLTGEVIVTRVATPAPVRMRFARTDGTVLFFSTTPVAFVSASGFVRIRAFSSDANTYRGTGEVRLNAASTSPAAAANSRLIGINQLPMEQYLYGVVPRELGPIAFPEVEASKAQAVAARTFARRRIQFCPASRCGQGYHVVPTTSDQVYGGFRFEHPMSNQAVNDTRGIVGTYNNAFIEGLYSSTSGGWTANSEDVFTATVPYLRGVPDHQRGQALAHVPSVEVFRNHGNPTNLRNHANGDFEADWSIYHRWYVSWTIEEMRQVAGRIGSSTFIDPGQVYAVNVLSRSSSGRVFEMEVLTEKRGRLTARKDAIRSFLRYITYNASGAMVLNSLRSTLVYVEPVIDPKTKAVVGWQAWGGGWGHGTGMSQTGAVGMAEKGHTYQEILAHYYQGVVLQQRW